jgi:hypothetical protein
VGVSLLVCVIVMPVFVLMRVLMAVRMFVSVLMVVVVFVVVLLVLVAGRHCNVRVNCGYAVLLDLADGEVETKSQPFQFGDHGFLIDPEVEQKSEEHVSGYAGEGVQVQNSPVCSLQEYLLASTLVRSTVRSHVPFIVV